MPPTQRTSPLANNPRARWLLLLALVVLGTLTYQRLAHTPPTSATASNDVVLTGKVMGTTWSLRFPPPPSSAPAPADLLHQVQSQLNAVDNAMSTYQADSELSRFNAHSSIAPFPISPATLEVFAIAAEISEASGGALDVTVRPLVALWGFGAGAHIPTAPTPAELATTTALVDFRQIHLDPAHGTLTKSRPAVTADLSAVAKGYAVDRAAEALLEHGLEDFLLEVGGELRAAGHHSDGSPWQVAVERPDSAGRTVLTIVELEDAALATSGDYRNYYEQDGVRRSHLLDPRTGRPIEHSLASVSVIHPETARADAWATALSILGPDEGWRVAEEQGLAVHFVVRQEDGSFATRSTPAFASHLPTGP